MKTEMIERPEFDLDVGQFEAYKQLIIKSEPEAQYVSDKCTELKNHIRATEDQRKKYTAPLDDLKKDMIADERKITEPLKMILKILKRKLAVWIESQEEIRRAEAEARRKADIAKVEAENKRLLAAAVEVDDEETEKKLEQATKNLERLKTKPVEVSTNVRGATGTSALRTYWKWELLDAAQVPREFLTVDERKVNAFVREHKGEGKIAGIKIFPIKGVSQQ